MKSRSLKIATRMIFRRFCLTFSTHSRILFSSEYVDYKIFIHEKCLEKYYDKCSENLSRPDIIDATPRYRVAARSLRNTAIQIQLQCIIYTDVYPHNVVDDVPVNQRDAHTWCILYMKESSPILFGAQIKNNWYICEETDFLSRRNFFHIFGINIYNIYDTAEVIAIEISYLQYENIHIIFVNGINIRIVVMACPKSSKCMYTSANIPRNVVLEHIITVII
jgi:hypothetical protein